uniref:RNA-directed RNA polymerase n=1 Tax=Beauveria bassiana chrysovirus 2 TaxID=2810134 RepID=A0A7U1GII8_9VIRU|nr:RNA-dependent RNA polymerase [Beauveria bassiana chrysovirus 2]
MVSVPTMAASYTSESGARRTLLRYERGHQRTKWNLQAVVIPMLGGKTSMAEQFSGYDIDEMVVGHKPLRCDEEWNTMIDAREDAFFYDQRQSYVTANSIMLSRARRFLAAFQGDCNSQVLYVHTAEMAVALGAQVVFCGSVAPAAVRASTRAQRMDDDELTRSVRLAGEQAEANRTFCNRHDLPYPKEYTSYRELGAAVRRVLTDMRLLNLDARSRAQYDCLRTATSVKEELDVAYNLCCDPTYQPWLRAVAARVLERYLGAALPEEAAACNSYATWARIILAAEQHRLPELELRDTERSWSEQFPYGPGNARFALIRIADWLRGCTKDSGEYVWFRQLMNRTDCTYERAACTAIMGDIFWYVAPELGRFAKLLPMGSLSPTVYAEVAKAIHAAVRGSRTMLGVELTTLGVSLCEYWDCLAGRYLGAGDMAKEIADRTADQEPRVYMAADGTKSAEVFGAVFAEEVRQLLFTAINDGGARMRAASEVTESFSTFLDYRKKWVRPGSVTGGPKADLYLTAVKSREEQVCDLADDIASMGTYVLQRVRLNKAATFEFKEFPDLVRGVLRDYVPNSFTRYFIKNEIGKPAGRALFPSHVTHYVVGQFVLYLLMKGLPLENVRLTTGPEDVMNDHTVWAAAREFTVGLMLDYDNFNEKHEFRDMQMIINELKGLYRVAGVLNSDIAAMIDWVVEAYDRTVLEYEDQLFVFGHGMLSGQAPTSAINNIINGANKRVIRRQVADLTGLSVMTNRTSGGDDVAAETNTLYEAAVIIAVGQHMNFAFSTHKQLISSGFYEFFRLMTDSTGVYGSLPRALGSICSGQWSNSIKAKFVDPAAKLGSIVEMTRKLTRRAACDMTFMDKICRVAFEKWATFGEKKLVAGYIHGTRNAGGLGIPMADGSILEIDPITVPEADEVQVTGMPYDASLVAASDQVAAALPIVGAAFVEDAVTLAKRMSANVFKANVAAMEGAGAAQAIGGWAGPDKVTIRQRKNIPIIPRHERAVGKEGFTIPYERHRMAVRDMEKAGSRYDSLCSAVRGRGRRRLAERIALDTGVDADRLYYWKEELTLYGCGTILLTEDYYSLAQVLAVVTSPEVDDDSMSLTLARYAMALDSAGVLSY